MNKSEFKRYLDHTSEGISSIRNLTYNNRENIYDILTFDTGIHENVSNRKTHDLHNGTTPFNSIRSNRRSAMSMVL